MPPTDGREAITIGQADIANLVRSKAGVHAAIQILLESTGTEAGQLAVLYVAGGFGNYLDVRKAIRIGMLPDIPVDRFQFIGNGSVQGAKIVLLSQQALAEAESIASVMTYIELSTDVKFMNEYTAALFLPHTNIEKFPSVRSEIEQSARGTS